MTRFMLRLYAVETGGERESVMLIKNSLCVDGTGLAGGGAIRNQMAVSLEIVLCM